MNVLVDTSIWSLALRRNKVMHHQIVAGLKELIEEHRVRIIGPIKQELLSGIKHQVQFQKLVKYLVAFPILSLNEKEYIKAAEVFNQLRAKGIQASQIDALICAVAKLNQLAIFTVDKDFLHYAKCLDLDLWRQETLT